MLRRSSVQVAARLLAEGQGGPVWAGFARQQQSSSGMAAAAAHLPPAVASALLPHLPTGCVRWHSELAERKPGTPEDNVVYVGPFSSAVKRVKVSKDRAGLYWECKHGAQAPHCALCSCDHA